VDPIVTNRLDPDVRLTEKRGDYDPPPRRRRPVPAVKKASPEEPVEATAHKIDDLA
jgi:hypothetical protein